MANIDWNDVALDELLNSPTGPVGQDLERRALAVENTQKRLLSMHGGGRVYTTRFFMRGGKLFAYGSRPAHQASAPGQPPAVDTGRLRASVGHKVDRDASGLYANVGSGGNPAIPSVKHAEYTEYGTRFMAPRPWLRPSQTAAEGEHHI
jgi:hypothetical protein